MGQEKILAAAAAIVVLSLARSASAEEECFIEKDGIGMGLVMPDEGCKSTLHSDVVLSAVTEDWSTFGLRGTAEVGWLQQVPDVPSVHLGPVLSLGGSSLAKPGEAEGKSEFEASVQVKVRHWLPPGDSVFYMEASVGPSMVVPPDAPTKVGAYAEIAASAHGVLGAFFSVQPIVDVEDGAIAIRYSLGGKTTAAGFAIAVAIYVCTEMRC